MLTACEKVSDMWGLRGQYAAWLRVEQAVALTQADLGIIPRAAAVSIVRDPVVDVEKIAEQELTTRHDVVAFLWATKERLSAEGQQYLHYGLTSSDIVDTALILRLRATVEHWREFLQQEPTMVVVDVMLVSALDAIETGKLSGPVGGHSEEVTPEMEDKALALLRLKSEPVSSQIIPRDRIASFVTYLGIASYIMQRRLRDPDWHSPLAAVLVSLENIALWHERDISHSSTERTVLPDLLFSMDKQIHRVGRFRAGREEECE